MLSKVSSSSAVRRMRSCLDASMSLCCRCPSSVRSLGGMCPSPGGGRPRSRTPCRAAIHRTRPGREAWPPRTRGFLRPDPAELAAVSVTDCSSSSPPFSSSPSSPPRSSAAAAAEPAPPAHWLSDQPLSLHLEDHHQPPPPPLIAGRAGTRRATRVCATRDARGLG